ncbi:MAG: acyl carrier protein [Polyangiaceae bacterium]|nr:acyl carrier protein [Polyangiaceae bacterium]
MSKQNYEIIRAFIASNFYVPDAHALADNASLLDQGIVDSTGVLEVTAFLESEFGIKVADDEIVPENLDTIANIVAFVRRKRPEPIAASAKTHSTSAVPA